MISHIQITVASFLIFYHLKKYIFVVKYVQNEILKFQTNQSGQGRIKFVWNFQNGLKLANIGYLHYICINKHLVLEFVLH